MRPHARSTWAADELEFQSGACGRLGSPLYRDLMARAAEDAEAGGVVADLLAPHAGAPRGAAMALRLFGTVHRLALEGVVPDLAATYPSCGGTADVDAAWPAFLAACHGHRDVVEAGLLQPPQTNEVGRGVALRGGLQHVVAATGLPVRLLELGASAGLNLRCERFGVDGGWEGAAPPDVPVEVVERRGCDIAPIDPTTAEGAVRLRSYVWPDMVARHQRLDDALRLAGQVPAELVRAGAAEFLATVAPAEGAVTVVQHSVMWQYLDGAEREAAQAELARLRDEATRDAPVAHLALEPHRADDDRDVDYRHPFALTLACWPHHDDRVLATVAPHGPPVAWVG